jgi:hypothetical protein
MAPNRTSHVRTELVRARLRAAVRLQEITGGALMDCLKCVHLEQVFESRLSGYSEARSSAFYQVSTELAAKKKVDMERARNDMQEHQLICSSRDTEPGEVFDALTKSRT